MVKFLIERPVGVFVTAFLIGMAGFMAMGKLPISLMPKIEIPHISILVEGDDYSSSELEQVVLAPLRRKLLQARFLQDMKSISQEGKGVIHLTFEFGKSMDYAFLDVNEKVDETMASLPASISRPRVVKSRPDDLPVVLVNVWDNHPIQGGQEESLLELSRFSEAVIKRRLEQSPSVAFVDINGSLLPEIQILPDLAKIKSLNIELASLEQAILHAQNYIGNITVEKNQLRYNLRIGNKLTGLEEIENIPLEFKESNIRLKDVAKVVFHRQEPEGYNLFESNHAISMAIIKKADARVDDLKKEIQRQIHVLKNENPQLGIELSRNQTEFLDYSIENLIQSLLIGSLLAFASIFLFLKDRRAPWLIGFSIPYAILVSFLFLYLLGISINILSLSGLVVSVGLMIDNSIIVIDNIKQFQQRNISEHEATEQAILNVFRPLLSSALTTCSVFLPLIFLGGLAGSLFFEQAITITVGIGVSLLVALLLIPVLSVQLSRSFPLNHHATPSSRNLVLRWYDKGLDIVEKQPWSIIIFVLCIIGGGIFASQKLKLEKLPQIEPLDAMVSITWNSTIGLEENLRRCDQLIEEAQLLTLHHHAEIGRQQFKLAQELPGKPYETVIYLKASSLQELESAKKRISSYINQGYSEARVEFRPAKNLFEQVLGQEAHEVELRLRNLSQERPISHKEAGFFADYISMAFGEDIHPPVPIEFQILKLDFAKLNLYGVSVNQLIDRLKVALSRVKIGHLSQGQLEIPIVISDEDGQKEQKLGRVLARSFVRSKNETYIPISDLVTVERKSEFLYNISDSRGPFVPFYFSKCSADDERLISHLSGTYAREHSGKLIDIISRNVYNQELQKQLALIIALAVLVLYAILAAQFESLLLPMIVLLEIPIGIASSLIGLWIGGGTLNLMSLIGMLVMIGIVINDSILKIDTINQHLRKGANLSDAIRRGGHQRLNAILMTSLTTIFAVLPFLFMSGIGAELQNPLAIALIAGMISGTLISLYLIPLVYRFIKKRSTQPRIRL